MGGGNKQVVGIAKKINESFFLMAAVNISRPGAGVADGRGPAIFLRISW